MKVGFKQEIGMKGIHSSSRNNARDTSFSDMLRYIIVSIGTDLRSALIDKVFIKEALNIIKFRCAQYFGTYRGNHDHRSLSLRKKEDYYYPSRRKVKKW